MPTNQEARQASVRAITGTAYAYNDDWHALFDHDSIAEGVFNDRLRLWINTKLSASYSNLNDAMRALAVANGVSSFWELGTFDASIGPDVTAPTITSSNTISLAENTALSHTLTANEAVTWTKTGGADTALFTLAGSTLSMAAKDYEVPTDAGTNNTYIVQVTATDAASNATNQTITVTVTDVAEGGGTAGQPIGLLLILTKAA